MRTPSGLPWGFCRREGTLGPVTSPGKERAASCNVYENCRLCMHGVPHPVLIAVYDEGKRDYALAAEAVCVARWASANRWHAAGDLCGDAVDLTVAGIGLCRHHAGRLTKWRYFEYPEEQVRGKTRELRDADREYEQAQRESDLHREKVNAARSVVYYIRRASDGAVKIGTTGSFRNRMAQLRKEHGEFQVLLTHSGTRREERCMHEKFAAYRIGQTEWFAPSKALLRFIGDERAGRSNSTQQRGTVSKTDLRKLVGTALADCDLQWRKGRVQWPLLAA